MAAENLEVIKCVAVGDGFVGKTSLLTRLSNKEFDATDYTPTVFDNSAIQIEHNGQSYLLHMIDTAGQEEYENLRTQMYTDAHVFLVCFSVTNVNSFLNVTSLWIPEVKKFRESASVILVGTKSDLRNDPETIDRMNVSQEMFISRLQSENCARSFRIKYVECSAKTQENIPEVLRTIKEVHFSKSQSKANLLTNNSCINPMMNFLRKVFCCRRLC